MSRSSATDLAGVIGVVALGPAVGLGHVSRNIAVLDELRKKGLRTELLVQAPGGAEIGFWAKGYPAVPWELCSDVVLPSRLAAIAHDPDAPFVVVADLPEGAEYDFDSLRSPGVCGVACLNAYGDHGGTADLAFLRGHSWTESGELPPGLRAGVEYEAVSAIVRARRPAEPWGRGAVERVLVTLGAADPDRLTEVVTHHCLERIPEVHVVVGPLFGSGRGAAFGALERRGAVVHRDPADLPGLLLNADLVISLGGQTAYEAMCLGRPVAAIRWASMARAVNFHVRNDTVADLGSPIQVPDRLKEVCRRPSNLARFASKAFQLLDGRGAERTAGAILDFFPALCE